jgi:hypothetical protein
MPRVYLRLISLTYVPSNRIPNILRRDVDRGTPGREVGSSEIHPCELMATWIYDEKFLIGIQFLSRMLSFTMVEDNDLESPNQEQEERHMMTIGFEFHRGLKNSATTFQAAVRQLAMTNLIDGLARPPIGAPSTTTRSSGLNLSENRPTKPEESV